MDELFLRSLRNSPEFVRLFSAKAVGHQTSEIPKVSPQTKHRQDAGSIDLELRYPNDLVLFVENKIDAGYSNTRSGSGQPDRYYRGRSQFFVPRV